MEDELEWEPPGRDWDLDQGDDECDCEDCE